MFSRAGWILLDGKPEFTDRRLNLPFCQQRLGQAAMATFPTGDHGIKFAKLGDSRVIVALVTKCIAEIIADRGFAGREPLSFAIRRDRIIETSRIEKEQSEIVVGFREPRIQRDSFAISGTGCSGI